MQAGTGQLEDPKRLWGVGEVLKLALPTGMGMLNATLMQFVDGLMVARIRPNGPEALSAQFSAGILSFAPQALMIGMLAVVSTFVAQNLGANRLRRCSQYAWQGLYLALAYSAAILPLAVIAGPIFGLLGHTPAVQALEVMYFRYMICGQVVFLGSRVLEQFFYGTHRPVVVYAVSVVANGLNLLGDYVLIYGKWGFPRLGLQGAAIATVGAAAVGLALLAWMFLRGHSARTFHTPTQWRPRRDQVVDLLRVGWPAGVQMFLDVLGWAVCITALVGSVRTVAGVAHPDASTVHLAASSVTVRYMHLAFLPTVGIGIAVTALVGRYIGARQMHLVHRRVYAALALGVGYMGLCGLVFWLARYPLVRFFLMVNAPLDPAAAQRTAEVVAVGANVMICAAVFQVFDAVSIVFIGALRGAGDTLWPMLTSAGLIVAIIIGGGILMLTVFPQWESVGVWIACAAFVVALGMVMAWRFRAGHWRKIDLLGGQAADE